MLEKINFDKFANNIVFAYNENCKPKITPEDIYLLKFETLENGSLVIVKDENEEIIFNNIPEEKFSVQENIAIENALQDVAVTNYSLSLNQEELNSLFDSDKSSSSITPKRYFRSIVTSDVSKILKYILLEMI